MNPPGNPDARKIAAHDVNGQWAVPRQHIHIAANGSVIGRPRYCDCIATTA